MFAEVNMDQTFVGYQRRAGQVGVACTYTLRSHFKDQVCIKFLQGRHPQRREDRNYRPTGEALVKMKEMKAQTQMGRGRQTDEAQ